MHVELLIKSCYVQTILRNGVLCPIVQPPYLYRLQVSANVSTRPRGLLRAEGTNSAQRSVEYAGRHERRLNSTSVACMAAMPDLF